MVLDKEADSFEKIPHLVVYDWSTLVGGCAGAIHVSASGEKSDHINEQCGIFFVYMAKNLLVVGSYEPTTIFLFAFINFVSLFKLID